MEAEQLQMIVLDRLKQYTGQHGKDEIVKMEGLPGPTVRRWITDSARPTGVRLLKLWFRLEQLGVPSPEMEDLNPTIRYLADLVVHDVVSVSDLQGLLGYTNEQGVLRALRGGSVPLEIDHLLVEDLRTTYGQALEERRRSMIVSQPISTKPSVQPIQAEEGTAPVVGASTDATIRFLASMLLGAMPLAEWLVSDSCSDEDRAQLREIVGIEQLQVLKTNIHQLTGKRARDFRQQGRTSQW